MQIVIAHIDTLIARNAANKNVIISIDIPVNVSPTHVQHTATYMLKIINYKQVAPSITQTKVVSN